MFKLPPIILCLWLLVNSVVFATPVNINTASAQEIAQALYGIGNNKARAIVDYRKQHGNFKSMHELARVKGIGKGIIAGNQGDIIID